MILLKIFVIFGLFVTSWAQTPYYGVLDNLQTRDKYKLNTLCHELVAEALYKIHQTDPIRDALSTKIGFQIGTVMGTIREKYRMMLEIYSNTNNKYTGKSKIIKPNKSYVWSIHYLWRMEIISWLEVEIDRLIHILEQIPLDFLTEYHDYREEVEQEKQRQQAIKEQMLKEKGRSGRSKHFDAELAEKEEEVKRGYRQDYLMKKLGLPANASKRFLERFPMKNLLNLDK